jgi:hypothetical protein
LLFSATAGLLCLVPTAATILWCDWAFKGAPEQQVLAVMGGIGLRMVFVIGVGMVLFHAVPAFQYGRFWIWVIVFYLFTLTVEMSLLLTRHTAADRSQNRS